MVLANSAGWSLVAVVLHNSQLPSVTTCHDPKQDSRCQKASITPSPWDLICACYVSLPYCDTNEISTPARPCGEKVTGFFLAGCVAAKRWRFLLVRLCSILTYLKRHHVMPSLWLCKSSFQLCWWSAPSSNFVTASNHIFAWKLHLNTLLHGSGRCFLLPLWSFRPCTRKRSTSAICNFQMFSVPSAVAASAVPLLCTKVMGGGAASTNANNERAWCPMSLQGPKKSVENLWRTYILCITYIHWIMYYKYKILQYKNV